MRKTLKTLLLSLLLTAMVLTPAFAEFVYVTPQGKRYHHVDSPYLKDKDVEKLTREEAEAQGYKPSKSFLKAEKAAKKAVKKKGQ